MNEIIYFSKIYLIVKVLPALRDYESPQQYDSYTGTTRVIFTF